MAGYHNYVRQDKSVIQSSYAVGSVSGASYVGGLIGDNNASVVNSYSIGAVTGTASAGGLIGFSSQAMSSVSAAYWNIETSGIAGGEDAKLVGQGMTTGELAAPTSATGIYKDWTAGGVWDFGTAKQYPALKADLNGDGTATVGEFGSQRAGAQIPATPTPASETN